MKNHNSFNTRKPTHKPAFTLAEVVISILITMILASGAMGYQYYSARDVKISEVQAGAARLSLLLLESWKGRQGDTAFDPVSEFGDEMTIQTSETGPSVPDNGDGSPLTLLGKYEIDLGDVTFYAALSYENASDTEPMLLNATVAWRQDYEPGQLDGNELFVQYSTFLNSYE